MGTKQYDKTIPELKLLMTKAKESGRPDVAAGIAKIMIQQDAEIKQEAAAAEKKAGEREAFEEHTPSTTPNRSRSVYGWRGSGSCTWWRCVRIRKGWFRCNRKPNS